MDKILNNMQLVNVLRVMCSVLFLAMTASCAWHADTVMGLDPGRPPGKWNGYLETNVKSNAYWVILELSSDESRNEVNIRRDFLEGWPHIEEVDKDKIIAQEANVTVTRADMTKIFRLLLQSISNYSIHNIDIGSSDSMVSLSITAYNTKVEIGQRFLDVREHIARNVLAILMIIDSYCPEYEAQPDCGIPRR